jgi:general transcription factor 3C polypeptide 5 (transcription factor C subunit 1)
MSYVVGLSDFQYSLSSSNFMNEVTSKLLHGDVSKLREFDIKAGIEKGPNVEILPPPSFTSMQLPLPYNYAQNPYTKYLNERPSDVSSDNTDEEFDRVVNITKNVKSFGHFLRHDEYPIPTAPGRKPNMSDPEVAEIIKDFRKAMDERPIWTRRSLFNHISTFSPFTGRYQKVRECLQYVGYQFKGGPWRDAVVKYGVDPRSDPKYRIYQTMIFKLTKQRVGSVGRSWQAVRRNEFGVSSNFQTFGEKANSPSDNLTHIFDGRSFSTDAKVWQVCDITDPLLKKLFEEAEVQTECSIDNNGWYKVALWGGVKAIMRTKLLAIRFGKNLAEWEWDRAVADCKKDEVDWGSSIGFTLPDLKLTPQEREQITGRRIRPGITTGRDRSHEKKKIYRRVKYNVTMSNERTVRENAKNRVQAARQLRDESDSPAIQDGGDDEQSVEPSNSGHLQDEDRENTEVDLDDEGMANTQQALFDYLSDVDEEDEDHEGNEDEVVEEEEEEDEEGDVGGNGNVAGPRSQGQYGYEDEDDEDEEEQSDGDSGSEADGDDVQGQYESGAEISDDEFGDEDGRP